MGNNNRTGLSREELLNAIDSCTTIADIFTLVKSENIDMRMQTLCSASNIPPKLLEYDSSASIEDPLVRLKKVVSLAVESQLSSP